VAAGDPLTYASRGLHGICCVLFYFTRRSSMAKGDRKTRRGKIFRGSHGKKRPKK
jgi:ribosomal small subunit protein bTHX